MPSLGTSEVEPTASAPAAPAGELAASAAASNAKMQPDLIIALSLCGGIRLVFLPARHNWGGAALAPRPIVSGENQGHPFVEWNAPRKPQALRPVGGERRRRLRGEQAGQDHMRAGRQHMRDRRR